ncbi:MAG: putative lipid II flippase FtsW [Ruminococcaceae bacterium]|nr:putative lipid II flippase FtsW [Oscillospiraceae bacterium]
METGRSSGQQNNNQRPSRPARMPQQGTSNAAPRRPAQQGAPRTGAPGRGAPKSAAPKRPAPTPQRSQQAPRKSPEVDNAAQGAAKKTPLKKERKPFSWADLPLVGWLSSRKRTILENERKQDEIPENLVRVRGGIDRPMLVIILLLLCYGSVMVFSSSYAYALSDMGDSYYFIRRQILFVILGLVAMVFVAHIDYKHVQRLTPLYFLICLAMMVAVLAVGISEGDAKRWLNLGFTTVQPSEFMKLGLVLMLAWYYHKADRFVKTKLFWRSSVFGTFLPMVIVGVVCLLIILENHFSGTIILFLIGMLVIFAAGGKWFWFLLGVGGFGSVVAFLIFATDYASKRIDIWLNPQNYSTQGEVWQTLQGLYAIGSGGILGVGLGNSTQKHLFVSQPQNDFIYSIICEELGLVGAVLVIALFLAFVWRGIKIAQNTPDTFSRLTVIGIVSKVGIQAFLNIAVVTGTIPNTGITLPFFSYGGSSLTILLAEMGILLGISRYSYQQK